MDTSETYIKMRLVAIPDLGMGIPPQYPNLKIWKDVWVDSKGDWYHFGSDGLFQLERQDQLQEIIGSFEVCNVLLFQCGYENAKYNKFRGRETSYWSQFRSMEQLWLAFVMKEKYNKVWDGENWVKEK